MMATDITVQILKEIRDGVVGTNERIDRTNERLEQTNERLEQTNERLEQTNERLSAVETALVDLATQQRFVVRSLRTLAARDHRFADDLDELRARVDAIEKRLP